MHSHKRMRESLNLMTTETTTTKAIALTIEEAADELRLGYDGVVALLRREEDPIPSFRYGRRVVIPRRELVEWASAQTLKETP